MLKHIIVSTGTSNANFKKTKQILNLNPALNFIYINIANSYSKHFIQFIAKAHKAWPTKTIYASNIVTSKIYKKLILSSANIIKVSIGPGSIYTTRIKTSIDYPQLSAIIKYANTTHSLGKMIISNDSCTTPSNMAKAFSSNANFIMLGSMLASHKKSGNHIIKKNGKKFMLFYSISSKSAIKRHISSIAKYRTAKDKTIKLPLQGPIKNTAQNILGSLHSACTYIRASRLKKLTKRTTFIHMQKQKNRIFNNL